MKRLLVLAAAVLLGLSFVSPTAEARTSTDTAGTFQLQLGAAVQDGGRLVIPVTGSISTFIGETGPWSGTIEGTLSTASGGGGGCHFKGEWTISDGDGPVLVERVRAKLTNCTGQDGGTPRFLASARARSADGGHFVGSRTFSDDFSETTMSGFWIGLFQAD